MATLTHAATASRAVATRSKLQREQVFWAYIFLLPWIIGLIVFGGMAVMLFLLVRSIVRHRRETGRWFPESSRSSWRSGGSSSSSSSSGFRGGGGSGGGGGASDRW